MNIDQYKTNKNRGKKFEEQLKLIKFNKMLTPKKIIKPLNLNLSRIKPIKFSKVLTPIKTVKPKKNIALTQIKPLKMFVIEDRLNKSILKNFKSFKSLHLNLKLLRQGVPRSSLKVPYSEEKNPNDAQFYKSNSKPEQNLFIPRYEVGVHRISGEQRFQIELVEATEGEGGMLKISLEAVPPEELKNQIGNAIPMDHTLNLSIKLNVPGTGGVKKSIPINELKKTAKGYDTTARVTNFNEFVQLRNAMSDSEYNCCLEVERSVRVAVPRFSEADPKKINALTPILSFTKKESSEIRGTKFNRIYLSISNWNSFSNELFKASPELPPCGRNKNASRTWLEIYNASGDKLYGYCALGQNKNLGDFSFAVRADKKLPSSCYVVLWDRKKNKRYTSNKVSLQKSPTKKFNPKGEKLYEIITKKFTETKPFHFSETRHAYIYRNIGAGNTIVSGYKPFRLRWDGDENDHIYLQEGINPKKFYYLPDCYVIARDDAPLFKPKINAIFSGENIQELKVNIEYQAEAMVSKERLENAVEQLQSQKIIPDKEIVFSPLGVASGQLEFKLFLPEPSGFSLRDKSLVTLEKIQDNLPPISLEAFQSLMSTISNESSASNLLTGQVEISLPGIPITPIPVSIRLTQIDPDMLILKINKKDFFQIEIKNTHSQTLSAQSISISIQNGEHILTDAKTNIAFPLKLAPGEKRMFTVIPVVDIENPEDAILGITWEGMQQHTDGGGLTDTLGSFSIIKQLIVKAHSIKLMNPIESTIKIDGLNALVQKKGKSIPLILHNISFPIILSPEKFVIFDALPSASIETYTSSDIFFSWEGLSQEQDMEQIFETIVDTSLKTTYEIPIKASLFINPISEDSTIRLLKIQFKSSENGPVLPTFLNFDGSDKPNVDSGRVEKEIKITLPIKDFVLGLANSGQYWFRITLIKNIDQGGGTERTKTVTGDWQIKTGSLEVTTEMLPKEEIVE